MLCYVAKENVIDSIEYFKALDISSDDMLFLFLFSKRLGITMSVPVTYQTGKLTEDQKKDYLRTIWLLGGLFDSSETCTKKGLLFPAAFSKLSSYQPGTEFGAVIGRIKDTIEKKNINVPIYKDNDSNLTLVANYRDLIKENYLNGNKISLSSLTAWLFRFSSFEFDSMPTEKQFTRVLEKAVRKFLKISKNDFLWLFDNDLSIKRISAATSGITGAEIRAQFAFEAGKAPEITSVAAGSAGTQSDVFDKSIVEKYLALNGDNPDEQDIFATLMMKKQIVLTGVPGVGKSRYTTLLRDKKVSGNRVFAETLMVQFHANYSYEDFIGYETLSSNGTGGTVVTTKKGVFLEFVQKASDPANRDNKYLFVIDELNRGNIAEIFGETILALDRGYTAKLAKPIDGVEEFSIPDNLYIVATMNTSDRNIAFLDLAIRRRFAFIQLMPNYDFLSEDVRYSSYDLGNILRIINLRILDTLKDSEMILGQSYFIPQNSIGGVLSWTDEDFKNQFNFVLLPTLKEYSFNDPGAVESIVGEILCDSIQDIDEFKAAFAAEFS